MTKEEMQAISDLLKPINDKLSSIDNRLNSVEKSQTKIKLKIENEVDRAIKTIGEGHTDLNRKMDKALGLEKRVETLENKMSAVEFAIQ